MTAPTEAVLLRSDDLEVAVTPSKGCDIRQIAVRATGRTILAETPWTPQLPNPAPGIADSANNWMRAYPGGWQLLLPNAGDASPAREQGFHGEASISAWRYEVVDDGILRARLDCFAQPLRVEREISVDGLVVRIHDAVTNTGPNVESLLWNHHVGLGGDLLAGESELFIAGAELHVDSEYDVPGNALDPGGRGVWPMAPTGGGALADLTTPLWGHSAFAYVSRLDSGRATLRRVDGTLGAELRWSIVDFPVCWLWEELGGTQGAPWYGRGRVVGIEPCVSSPGRGLDRADATGQRLLQLQPDEVKSAEVTLSVTHGTG